MALERTLSIIKPDAVQKNAIGAILSRFENAGLQVVAARMLHLSAEDAGGFYAVHKHRPFYGELCAFMSSGPILVSVLEGENAIAKNRDLMGATNPKDATPAPFVQTLPKASTPTPCMAPTAPRRPPGKFPTSFRNGSCARAHERSCADQGC